MKKLVISVCWYNKAYYMKPYHSLSNLIKITRKCLHVNIFLLCFYCASSNDKIKLISKMSAISKEEKHFIALRVVINCN